MLIKLCFTRNECKKASSIQRTSHLVCVWILMCVTHTHQKDNFLKYFKVYLILCWSFLIFYSGTYTLKLVDTQETIPTETIVIVIRDDQLWLDELIRELHLTSDLDQSRNREGNGSDVDELHIWFSRWVVEQDGFDIVLNLLEFVIELNQDVYLFGVHVVSGTDLAFFVGVVGDVVDIGSWRFEDPSQVINLSNMDLYAALDVLIWVLSLLSRSRKRFFRDSCLLNSKGLLKGSGRGYNCLKNSSSAFFCSNRLRSTPSRSLKRFFRDSCLRASKGLLKGSGGRWKRNWLRNLTSVSIYLVRGRGCLGGWGTTNCFPAWYPFAKL